MSSSMQFTLTKVSGLMARFMRATRFDSVLLIVVLALLSGTVLAQPLPAA